LFKGDQAFATFLVDKSPSHPFFSPSDKYASLLGTNYCMWLGSLPMPQK